MKISLDQLLVESSKLQDHRQQSCVIRKVTAESVVFIIRSPREDERIYNELAVIADTGMHRFGQV